MSTPFGPILLVANPSAGRGRNAVLPEVVAALTTRGIDNVVSVTKGPQDATRIAREAVTNRGIRFVVAVGGDGTVNEVVNGLVDAESGEPVAEDIVFGAVAGGTGCDFVKTFGLDRPIDTVVGHFTTEHLYPIDLGRIRYLDRSGVERVRLFANIAECGWGAEVTDRVNNLPKLLGQARYPLAILSYARRMQLVDTTVTIDHTTISEPMTEVVVANCQFFGSGLKIAPRAIPDDGTFNVQTWRSETADVLRNLPKARVGEHLSDPKVREYQSSLVEVTSAEPLLVEADGEVLGTTPATFDVLEKVLRLKI